MLNAQKRHAPPCKRTQWDAGYTRCSCPVVIRGTVGGKFVSLSTAKYLPPDKARDMEAARDLALLWERTGAPVRPAESAPLPPETPKEEDTGVTIERGIERYMAAAKARGNRDSTTEKRRNIFTTGPQSLQWFATHKGLRHLSELDLTQVEEWRNLWNVGDLTRHKRQCQVLGFFWFCERRGWFPRNFAADLTAGLGKIQVKATQTDYFLPSEYARILDATALYSDRPSVDKHNSLTDGGRRIRALTELMRWTGLRIRCAVTLEKSKLQQDPFSGMWSVIVYQKKTGEPVYCPIPPDVAQMLLTVPASQKGNTNETYFFWTGAGKPKTLVSNWERSYAKLFALAGMKKRCFPHMFRDTFAVESLLAGMPLEQVSIILGHASVKTTEESYMPWVRARQISLNTAVYESWVRQGKVAPLPPKRARVVPITAVVG